MSTSLKSFVDLLNMWQTGNVETNCRLQAFLSVLLKKAQERCVLQMIKLQERRNESQPLTRDMLKREAKQLLLHELKLLMNTKMFTNMYQKLAIRGEIKNQSTIKIKTANQQNTSKTKNVCSISLQSSSKTIKNTEKQSNIKLAKTGSRTQSRNSLVKLQKPKSDVASRRPEVKADRLTGSTSVPITAPAKPKEVVKKTEVCRGSTKEKTCQSLPALHSKKIIQVPVIPISSKTQSLVKTNEISNLDPTLLWKFEQIQDTVDRAIRSNKTFTVNGWPNLIRRCLQSRGWVEKIVITKQTPELQVTAEQMTISDLLNNVNDPKNGYIYNRLLKSKLLATHQVDLIIEPRPLTYNQLNSATNPVFINHFRKRGEPDFCSKIGLNYHMRNLRWTYQKNISDVHFPRTYIITDNEMADFINDFRITACLALLKWTIERHHSNKKLLTNYGQVPIDAFYFALLHCKIFAERDDTKFEFSLQSWHTFIDHYHQCVYRGEHFCSAQVEDLEVAIAEAKHVVDRCRLLRPELDFEGNFNIWILKPDQHSRGQGIHVCRRMCQIKGIIAKNVQKRYLIQKYIEKPLLIYNTKFDIRQWFLVSSAVPLTVWMYQECYLRFSSQQYQPTRFHESVHLTNNSVQSKYKNNAYRDPNLPKDNMWDSNRFETYLKSIGHPHAWSNIIYPKMKEAIMAVLLSAKGGIEQRPYSFELYGADFMVTPDFQPWLIEVNSHPAMSPSTSVTAKMCPQVIDDMIKVVIDGHWRPNCHNGKFELIFKDETPNKTQSQENFSAQIQGTPLSQDYYQLLDESMNYELILPTESDSLTTNLENLLEKIGCYN